MHYQNVKTEFLKEIADWEIARREYQINQKCCYLHIISDVPGLLKDIDSSKLQEVQSELITKLEPYQYYTMNNIGQWSIVALPNKKWATKVFPNLDEDAAYDRLLSAILDTVMVNEKTDPIDEWDIHNNNIIKRRDLMNKYHFKSLHFKNSLNTDIVIDLNDNHIWAGGCEHNADGIVFNPNMPTQEIFTMPKRNFVNGIVYATKPLNYQGKLIEDFYLEFKDGKVINYEAKHGNDTLKNLLDTDEGSRFIGEVALIEHDSPISNTNILFYNTLFDENASCHVALGSCYPTNMTDGETMNKEELVKNNANVSKIHVDFMFGSKCMNITGMTQDNKSITLFENGKFVLSK